MIPIGIQCVSLTKENRLIDRHALSRQSNQFRDIYRHTVISQYSFPLIVMVRVKSTSVCV